MKFTLGKKVEMTQFFTEDGLAHAATIIQCGPNVVTRVRTQETDGYDAVAVGFGTRKAKNLAKAQKSQWGELGSFEVVREFRDKKGKIEAKVGDIILPSDMFEAGDTVQVSGTSKGKGFQGVVKRYNFAGGRRSHGQKHSERERGSSGATGPARVFKGMRMPGRMGSDRVTVKNLSILAVDEKTNTILIKGAVPGRRGTILEIVQK